MAGALLQGLRVQAEITDLQVLHDCQVGKEALSLGHVGDSLFYIRFRFPPGDLVIPEEDLPLPCGKESEQSYQERRLPGSVVTDGPHHFSVLQPERNSLEDPFVMVAACQI